MKEIIIKTVRENRLEYTADCAKECFTYWKQQIETKPDFDCDKEYFVVLCLDNRLQIICHNIVTMGINNQTLVHARETFRPAIACASNTIIVMHNHPSSYPKPSQDDISTTHGLIEAGKIIGIPVQDHVIICGDSFYSFKDYGII